MEYYWMEYSHHFDYYYKLHNLYFKEYLVTNISTNLVSLSSRFHFDRFLDKFKRNVKIINLQLNLQSFIYSYFYYIELILICNKHS